MEDFFKKIESMIKEMEEERRKVQRARVKADHHSNWVASRINDIIKKESNENANSPVDSLGLALSKVPNLIVESFKNLEDIESNIVVTIQAYTRVKNELVALENEKKQIESKEGGSDLEADDSRPRKPGTRPKNKISQRKRRAKTDSKEKSPAARKNKSKKSEEATD